MNIISRYSDIPGLVVNEAKIPCEIRGLLALAIEWNITDYLELEAYINAAAEHKRRHLVESFAPHFDFITSWIGQSAHLMPLPDEVVVFDIAASAALKVRATLPVFEINYPLPSQLGFAQTMEFIGA